MTFKDLFQNEINKFCDECASENYQIYFDGGLENNSIWNSIAVKGLFFQIFFNYFLPKTRYIQSSDNNSKEASSFWIKAVKQALLSNKRSSIVDFSNNSEIFITNANYLQNNFDDVWGNANHHLRIRIYND